MRARKRDRDGGPNRSNGKAKQTGNRARSTGANRTKAGNRAGGRGRPTSRGRKGRGREAELWGDASSLPPPRTDVRITDDPAAVPRSLGKPPLPGHEVIAEHYFGVVYERAVMTAGALAAAGGLIDHSALADRDED